MFTQPVSKDAGVVLLCLDLNAVMTIFALII